MENNEYPVVMDVTHIQKIMGISKRRAYEIMDIEGFPTIRMGRSKRVHRDKFFQWLEKQAG